MTCVPRYVLSRSFLPRRQSLHSELISDWRANDDAVAAIRLLQLRDANWARVKHHLATFRGLIAFSQHRKANVLSGRILTLAGSDRLHHRPGDHSARGAGHCARASVVHWQCIAVREYLPGRPLQSQQCSMRLALLRFGATAYPMNLVRPTACNENITARILVREPTRAGLPNWRRLA